MIVQMARLFGGPGGPTTVRDTVLLCRPGEPYRLIMHHAKGKPGVVDLWRLAAAMLGVEAYSDVLGVVEVSDHIAYSYVGQRRRDELPTPKRVWKPNK